MAKQRERSSVLNMVAWITGVIVSLVVGFGMINGTLRLPMWLGGSSAIGMWIVLAAGWVVVITTLVGAVLALLQR
jgi:hypothetical protein